MIAVPGFLSAGIDPSTIVDIVNYVTIGLLAGSLIIALLGFVRGLFRGWRYGTYRLVMFAILAAVALFTLQPIINAVGNFDLSQFGLGTSWELPVFTLAINGTNVTIASSGTTAFTAVSGYVENLCKALNVNMSPADLSAYALSIAISFLSLLMIMVDAILIAVFGTFFVFLLWHLAFKRFVRKEKRKASYRKGKLVGGLTNCLVSIICLAMLLAPLTSMANSLSAAWHKGQLDQEDQTTLHTVDNSVYQAIDGAVKAYDNSAFAQAFFAWTKDSDGETLDMKLVDFLTSTSVSLGEQEQVQMFFLSEVSSLAQVFTIAVQSGVISEDGFNNIKWPLLLTTSAAPEALRSLASSRLVTGILPYGLSVLENIDPVSSYIKVGTGIDFSDNNYQLTLEELADIYDEVIHSNLIDGVVDPDTGELGSSSEVAGNVLSEENASLVASIFESLDGENLKIFDALIESALTIQAFKDYESGKVARIAAGRQAQAHLRKVRPPGEFRTIEFPSLIGMSAAIRILAAAVTPAVITAVALVRRNDRLRQNPGFPHPRRQSGIDLLQSDERRIEILVKRQSLPRDLRHEFQLVLPTRTPGGDIPLRQGSQCTETVIADPFQLLPHRAFSPAGKFLRP